MHDQLNRGEHGDRGGLTLFHYPYTVGAIDFHFNQSNTTVNVTTPPAAAIDPRRTGVRPTGAYWGGLGENIDMLSGNLNFTLPLVKAQGRGGWSVPFNLTYNSLNWRKDNGGTWKLGYDIGYGFGWKLQAGSLIPTSSGGVSHYLFTDATGAEYDLNVQSGGVWTQAEGIYATFDPSTVRLKFNDGSFWVMGCVAAAAEADAGTMYPTLMQDSNGNQVIIRYLAGAGVSWSNSSGRIQEIEDVRATWQGSGYATYRFTYSNGRLTGISNTIGSGESYTFNSETGQPLVSPFDGSSQGQTGYLRSVEVNGLGKRHTFATGSSGQLTRVTFPYGGYVGWDYTNYGYQNARYQPEVRYRKLSKDGSSEVSYRLDREDDSNVAVHSKATLYDPNGTSNKVWEFTTSGTFIGLASSHSKRESATVLSSETYTWTVGAGGPYISEVLSQLGAVKKKTQQTVDSYGNVTQVKQYDWGAPNGAPGALLKTMDYGYLTPPAGNPYVRNRIVYADVTGAGFTAARLFQNTYDVYGTIADMPQVRQHDAAVGTSYQARGNVTSRTDPNGQTLMNYDIGGNVVWSRGPTGAQGSVSYQSGTNFAAPSALTVGSLMESLAYSTFGAPASATGPNGETASTSYDSYGRISGTTTATGVSTTYSYSTSAPWTVTATTEQRWVKQTLDGFGRTVKTETGTGGTTLSVVDTEYDVCACTPTGKVKRTSLPHAPNATVLWTTNAYDALGRTRTVTSSFDSTYKEYVYSDNTVTAYDEERKWKKYWFDGLGNLVQVNEPNPADASHDAISVYTYDALGHLTNVDLRRWNAIASVYEHQ